MFGPSYVFAVETAKAADIKPGELFSTPQLAAKFNPGKPADTSNVPK
jgi:oligogalacturonide lyase